MGSCRSGEQQSPINLTGLDRQPEGQFTYEYWPVEEPLMLRHTGLAFSVDFINSAYGGVKLGGAWHSLLTLNAHVASEHLWDGVRMPAELHLVHQRYDKAAIVILAVALEEGNHNPALQMLLEGMPACGQNASVNASFHQPWDLTDLVAGGLFQEYNGSLTVPPCTERATWLVRQEAVGASRQQIAQLQVAVLSCTNNTGNYRRMAPLNEREVRVLQAVRKDPSNESVVRANVTSVAAYPWADVIAASREAEKFATKALHVANLTATHVMELRRVYMENAKSDIAILSK